MIYIIYADATRAAGDLVYAAFCRAFSANQVVRWTSSDWFRVSGSLLVLVEPTDACFDFFRRFVNTKILIFGKLPHVLAQHKQSFIADVGAEPAPAYAFRESALRVRYQKKLGSLESPILDRAFLRYDFRDEWNHTGCGAIRADGSIWALAEVVDVPEAVLLAEVTCNNTRISAYAAHWDENNSSILWFNRAVGVIDSQEWRFVEYFFASYRYTELPCVPVLSDIPAGWDAAVTMRLDCDEEIASARELFEHYQSWNVPFSLAIHTALLGPKQHTMMLQDVIAHHGAILSHSATHPAHWGGNYDAAYREACDSAAALHAVLGEIKPLYAVSPFHQTPAFALRALADAHYAGCVGGIVSSDPEFLLARGGAVFNQFIGHAQSCMLHGECLLAQDDALQAYKQAFAVAKRGRALFGFLDHPFSARYSYGWSNEAERIRTHQQFIEYMRAQGRVLFLNEQDALNFLRYKSGVYLSLGKNKQIFYRLPECTALWNIAIEFAEQIVSLTENGVSI